jgi:hypothetical protein
VQLVTPSNVGAETALQSSANSFYFALDQAGPGQTTFVGPVSIEGASASLRVIDTGDNVAVAITAPNPGQGSIFLNSTGVDGQTNSIGITGGATAGQFSITSIGAIAPGNILNYDQTTPSVQLGNVGGIVEVRGLEGLGQVYDDVNNPVITPTNVFTMATYNGAFTTLTDVAYTPANSGYYLVTYALTANGAGISWGTPNGSAVVNTGLTLTQGSLVYIADSEVAYYGIIQGPLTDTKQVLVYLTGGVAVYNDFQNVGTANAGASGGLVVNIQPFACNFGVIDAPAPPA